MIAKDHLKHSLRMLERVVERKNEMSGKILLPLAMKGKIILKLKIVRWREILNHYGTQIKKLEEKFENHEFTQNILPTMPYMNSVIDRSRGNNWGTS